MKIPPLVRHISFLYLVLSSPSIALKLRVKIIREVIIADLIIRTSSHYMIKENLGPYYMVKIVILNMDWTMK
jgi:hypothetical protein